MDCYKSGKITHQQSWDEKFESLNHFKSQNGHNYDDATFAMWVNTQRSLVQLRPPSAMAYEVREVGGADRSATTAAFNIQNQKTYERLEKSGFPLDTRADEQARLADALSSFSYPAASSSSSTPSKEKKDGKRKN